MTTTQKKLVQKIGYKNRNLGIEEILNVLCFFYQMFISFGKEKENEKEISVGIGRAYDIRPYGLWCSESAYRDSCS
jgi:hypothetical protein